MHQPIAGEYLFQKMPGKMIKIFRYIFLLLFCTPFSACDNFDYNVNQTNFEEYDPEVTTAYNVERLLKLPKKDTLHLVFTGDIQRFYNDMHDLVNVINALPEVDAVIITGDLTDFGIALNYELLNNQLKLLKVPFITVIGNHDCLANGAELYQEIYGPLNHSFTWNDLRFILHNTNSREFSFNGQVPDLYWMQQQVTDTSNFRGCIFISHVPPYDDDFDSSLEAAYTNLVRNTKNTVFSSNGHRHVHTLHKPYNDGIWYLNTSSPSNRIYSYVTIYPYADPETMFTCDFISF
jgi:Icc-related predicted phosphoesterase